MKENVRLKKALKMVAPGTILREGLDHILKASTGALIVVGDSEEILSICNGGFTLDCSMTPQRLYELAKMDGALILNSDASSILFANVHLVPDPSLPTRETGMRHRSAERAALQTDSLVIAISERRRIVTLYEGDLKFSLEEVTVILTKATQALQTLERHKYHHEQLSSYLNALELEDLVTLGDVSVLIQRFDTMVRVAKEIQLYIQQLGEDGRLINVQLDELIGGVEEDYLLLLEDYRAPKSPGPEEILEAFAELPPAEPLEVGRICALLGHPVSPQMAEIKLTPKGLRLLSKIPRLPTSVAYKVGDTFQSLSNILGASLEDLDKVEGVGEARARAIKEGLERLREYLQLEHTLG